MILSNVYTDIIAISAIIIIIGEALLYIVKAKKNGVKCIGCPDAKTCAAKNLKKLCCEEIKKLKEENE